MVVVVVTGIYLMGENEGGTEKDFLNVSGVVREESVDYGGCVVRFDFEGLLENR